MLFHHDFQSVSEESIRQRRDFLLCLLRVGKIQDVTEPNSHLLSLEITAQPAMLISVCAAVTQIFEDLFGGFPPPKLAALLDLIDQVRHANRQFCEILRAVKC